MDQDLRSSEGFIKKKSSSGCLIIKKKITPPGGVGPQQRKFFGSNETRERLERRNFGVRISGSSEESDRFYNGEGILGNNQFGRNYELEGERRRKFDGVAFDENVGMYRKRMRKDHREESSKYDINDNRNSPYFVTGSADVAKVPISPPRQKFRVPYDKPIRVQGKNGVLKVMVNKSKNVNVLRQFYEKYIDDGNKDVAVSTNLSVGPSLHSGPKYFENGNSSVNMRANAGDSELFPKSTAMINKKKDMHTTRRSYDYPNQDLVIEGSKSEIDINKNAPITPVFSPDSKLLKNGNSLIKEEKSGTKLQSSLTKRTKKNKPEKENSDSLLKQEPRSDQVGSSSKAVKNDEKAPLDEKPISVKGKEAKVKRGTGTEKQLLREKIRHKLVSSGWTINYKPRKNRDYLDAVYINPTGTAYWSIIKAYEAFKKQVGEEDVPEELLNKLTRQTRKKMEKEMEMKQRKEAEGEIGKKDDINEDDEEDTENDDNDEKLSFPKKQKKAEKSSTDKSSHIIQEKKTQQISKCTLLVRSSDKGSKSQNDGDVPYMGKRTLLAWLIDSGTIRETAEVNYMNRKQTKVMLKGWISREGIHCGCCSKIVTVSKFEIHAGSKLRQPFQNIFLESGKSLLQCQIEAWNKQDEAKCCGFYNLNIDGDDGNDDACGICGDGGDLMCCDGCPSTFHQSCMGLRELPPGDWHCPNCTCKFCQRSSARGNNLLTCRLCERKYHKSCKKDIDDVSADVDRESTLFCGKKCREIFSQLQKILEIKHELEAGFSWSLIRRTDIDTDASQHDFPLKVECNSKLAVALSVIEECFLPINDRRSGINLIHNIVYNRGSNYSRLNHSGFYTAILERGDEIIAAASIRIHGTQLAEMPFIGTRHIYRRQGMCRRLLCAIESALSSLKVEKLIIPAIGEHMYTWTGVFGFNPVEESHKKEMRSLKMFVFPRTEMLQKMLAKQNTIEEHLTAESGAKSNVCEGAKLISSSKTDTKTVSIGNESSSSSLETSKDGEANKVSRGEHCG